MLVGISFAVAVPVGLLLAAVGYRIIDPPSERDLLHGRVTTLEREVARIRRALAHSPDPVLQALSYAGAPVIAPTARHRATPPVRRRLDFAYGRVPDQRRQA